MGLWLRDSCFFILIILLVSLLFPHMPISISRYLSRYIYTYRLLFLSYIHIHKFWSVLVFLQSHVIFPFTDFLSTSAHFLRKIVLPVLFYCFIISLPIFVLWLMNSLRIGVTYHHHCFIFNYHHLIS